MIKIIKNHEPAELIRYREKKPVEAWRPSYDEMGQVESGHYNPDGTPINLHDYVLDMLIKEQGGLCAYCMCSIPEIDRKTGVPRKPTIEHIIPQSMTKKTDDWKMELTYSNFLEVCSGNAGRGKLCCDKARKHTPLSLNPLDNSAVSTFCWTVANDEPFTVNDRSTELELLYIDDLVEGIFDLP